MPSCHGRLDQGSFEATPDLTLRFVLSFLSQALRAQINPHLLDEIDSGKDEAKHKD